MDMSAFAVRLAEVGAEVEAELEELLALGPRPQELARPERLLSAMRHGVLGGGKRLRPFLTIETARALGVTGAASRRAGAAIECVHGYSLIHDDLPAMDDDDLRRGRPTVHRAYDEATAILAGDALLTLAFEVMADPATHPVGETRAALCLGLARGAGLGSSYRPQPSLRVIRPSAAMMRHSTPGIDRARRTLSSGASTLKIVARASASADRSAMTVAQATRSTGAPDRGSSL